MLQRLIPVDFCIEVPAKIQIIAPKQTFPQGLNQFDSAKRWITPLSKYPEAY